MSSQPNNPYAIVFERLSKAASACAMLTGASILIGWYSEFVPLMRLMPGSILTKANTGALLLLAGLALWLLQTKTAPPWLVILRRACSALVLLVGLLTLSEYLFGWDLGIDQLLAHETLEFGGVFPGRMAPASAVSFTLLGSALWLRADTRRASLAQMLTVPVLVLGLVSIVGHIFGAHALLQVGDYTYISLPAAIIVFIMGLGVNFVRPDEGGMAVLMSPGVGGFLARNLLPVAIVVPIALGWAQLWAESTGRYNELLVEAIAVVAQAVILAGAGAWSILALHKVDLERKRAADEVQRLNRELEDRVRRRTAQLEQANEFVEQERDQLQILMDNIPDTIYFKDAASRFTRINAAQARTLGLEDPQQAIGKTDADFFAPESAAAAYADEQRMIHTGESIVDRREFNPTLHGQARWFSSTKMPVHGSDGKVVGLVGISRDITERMSDEHFAGAERAQLTERIEQMALVIEMSEQLQACAVDAEVYQVASRLAGRLFPGALGALYAIDPVQESVVTAATWGTPPLEAETFEVDDCWALRRGKPHYWGGEHTGELCPHLAANPPAYSICLPLAAAGERLGILHLRSAPDVELHALGEIQMQSAELTADSLALAWANVRLRESLHEQAVRDPLTGLYNRRHMQASFEREIRRAERNKKPIGIIMLDIDHFKEVNDTHGHDAGDVVLRELGRFLKEHTRAGDIACRLGGEEFIIILPEANLEQTAGRAEKHRQQFCAERIEYQGRRIDTPTLSIGVAAYPVNGNTSEDLLRAADAALYLAKEAGRNRVAVAQGTLDQAGL